MKTQTQDARLEALRAAHRAMFAGEASMGTLYSAVKNGVDLQVHWQDVIEKFGAFLVKFHEVRRECSAAGSPPRSAVGQKAVSPRVGGQSTETGDDGHSGDSGELSNGGAMSVEI